MVSYPALAARNGSLEHDEYLDLLGEFQITHERPRCAYASSIRHLWGATRSMKQITGFENDQKCLIFILSERSELHMLKTVLSEASVLSEGTAFWAERKCDFFFGFSHTVRKAVELFYLRFHIACASNPSKWWNAAPCWKREEDQEQGSLLYYSKKKSKKYIFLKQCSFGSKWFLPLCCRRKSRKLCCGWVGCALKNAPKSPRIWEGFLSRKRGNGQREPLCELWDDATTGDITVMRSSG